MAKHFMNPAHGKHMGHQEGKESGDVHESSGQHHAPSIHIHSHSEGHTVHIMHHDGQHEKHEHSHGDDEGIASHIHEHIGGEGQDHGYSSGETMEDEHGYGSGV